MICPKCGNDYCKIVTDTEVKGKDFSLARGVAASILFRNTSTGFVAGLSNSRKMEARAYWVCDRCGHKFER